MRKWKIYTIICLLNLTEKYHVVNTETVGRIMLKLVLLMQLYTKTTFRGSGIHIE